jgi:hypothetical protein
MREEVFTATYRTELNGGVQDPSLIAGLLSKEAKWSLPDSTSYDSFSVRVLKEFGKVFNGLNVQEQRKAVSENNTPTIGETFFTNIMSPKEWDKYKAQGNTSYCSTFGYENLVSLDPRIAVSVFPHGFVRANSWEASLAASPLFTEVKGIDAQNTMIMAAAGSDAGQLVIGALNAYPDPGHIAFVVPSATQFQSYDNIVTINGSGTLGYSGNAGNLPGFTIPVYAGVGGPKATGILPFGLTFGSKEREDPYFYSRVKYYRLGW